MKEKKDKIFGYNEDEVKQALHSEELTSVNTPKIEPDKTTLETLSESSKKLILEDKKFLKDIYQ